MPAPISIIYKGIEYRSIRQLLENVGIGFDRNIFRDIHKKEYSLENILISASKKQRKLLKCQN